MPDSSEFDDISLSSDDEEAKPQPQTSPANASPVVVQQQPQAEIRREEASDSNCLLILGFIALAFARFLYRAAGTLSSMSVYYFTTWSSLQFLIEKMGFGDSQVAQDLVFAWMTIWTINFIVFSPINGMASKQSITGSITALNEETDVFLFKEVRDQTPGKKVMAGFTWAVYSMHRLYLAAGVTRTILNMLSQLISPDGLVNDIGNITTPAYVPPENDVQTWGVSIGLVGTVIIYVQTMCLWSGPSLVKKLLFFLYRCVDCCGRKKPATIDDVSDDKQAIEMTEIAEDQKKYVAIDVSPEEKPEVIEPPKPKTCLAKLAREEKELNDRGFQLEVVSPGQESYAAMGCLMAARWIERVIVIISEVLDYAGSVGTLLDEVFEHFGFVGEDADRLGLGIAFCFSAVTVVVTTLFIIHCQEPIPLTRYFSKVLCGLWCVNQKPNKQEKKSAKKKQASRGVKIVSGAVSTIFGLTRASKVFFKSYILVADGRGGEVHLGEGWVPDNLANVLAWMYLSNGGVITLSVAHGVLTVLAKAVNAYSELNALMAEKCGRSRVGGADDKPAPKAITEALVEGRDDNSSLPQA